MVFSSAQSCSLCSSRSHIQKRSSRASSKVKRSLQLTSLEETDELNRCCGRVAGIHCTFIRTEVREILVFEEEEAEDESEEDE